MSAFRRLASNKGTYLAMLIVGIGIMSGLLKLNLAVAPNYSSTTNIIPVTTMFNPPGTAVVPASVNNGLFTAYVDAQPSTSATVAISKNGVSIGTFPMTYYGPGSVSGSSRWSYTLTLDSTNYPLGTTVTFTFIVTNASVLGAPVTSFSLTGYALISSIRGTFALYQCQSSVSCLLPITLQTSMALSAPYPYFFLTFNASSGGGTISNVQALIYNNATGALMQSSSLPSVTGTLWQSPIFPLSSGTFTIFGHVTANGVQYRFLSLYLGTNVVTSSSGPPSITIAGLTIDQVTLLWIALINTGTGLTGLIYAMRKDIARIKDILKPP